MNSKTEIRFLVVSDIHDNIQNVRKLVDWYQKEKPKIDYILCCGDIVTVPNDRQDEPEQAKIYEPIIVNIFQELEKICSQILYVPGNHEPYTLFQKDPPFLTKGSINLHKKYIKLSDDLYMVGIGGSTPILQGGPYEIGQVPYHDVDLKKVKYAGYPYNVKSDDNYLKSDLNFVNDLKEAVEQVKKEGGDNVNMILLSHIGPLYTWTNVMTLNGENLYLGSEQLGQWFFYEKGCFLDIHGHTHTARGVINITDKKIVMNPGDLASGNYGMAVVKKDQNNEWVVESTSLNLV